MTDRSFAVPVAFEYRQCHIVSYLDATKSQELVDSVLAGGPPREKVFRDNWRTLSARVSFHGDSLLLKVPRARNSRRWEGFLTRFRGSDALRTLRHLELMSAMGFSAPQPVLACECRRRGVVTDSFVCYRFVEGRPAEPEDAPRVLASLQALHQRGYLRNDPQLANFVVSDETITFIDFRLKKPWFLPELQKAREVVRFLRSCPEAEGFLRNGPAVPGWLWIATGLESISGGVRNLKKKVRNRLKSAR